MSFKNKKNPFSSWLVCYEEKRETQLDANGKIPLLLQSVLLDLDSIICVNCTSSYNLVMMSLCNLRTCRLTPYVFAQTISLSELNSTK